MCFGASAFVIQEQRCLWVVGHPEVEREGDALPKVSHGLVQIELKKRLTYVQMDLILISKMLNTSMIFIMVTMNQ